MRRLRKPTCLLAGLGLALAALVGCQSPLPGAVLYRYDAPANLALGPQPYFAYTAPRFAERSDWPYVENGYDLGEVSTYTVIRFDDQQFHERDGSYFYNSAESVSTGTILR